MVRSRARARTKHAHARIIRRTAQEEVVTRTKEGASEQSPPRKPRRHTHRPVAGAQVPPLRHTTPSHGAAVGPTREAKARDKVGCMLGENAQTQQRPQRHTDNSGHGRCHGAAARTHPPRDQWSPESRAKAGARHRGGMAPPSACGAARRALTHNRQSSALQRNRFGPIPNAITTCSRDVLLAVGLVHSLRKSRRLRRKKSAPAAARTLPPPTLLVGPCP